MSSGSGSGSAAADHLSRGEIRERVRRVFLEQLSIRDVDEDTHLFSDLDLDSIQQLTLVVEIENEFRVSFRAEDEDGIQTVGHVVDAVAQARERQRSSASS